MILFRSGSKLDLEFFCHRIQLLQEEFISVVSLGTQKRLRYSWTTAQKKTFFLGLYGTFFSKVCFAEHWLAKFEFVNGVLTY